MGACTGARSAPTNRSFSCSCSSSSSSFFSSSYPIEIQSAIRYSLCTETSGEEALGRVLTSSTSMPMLTGLLIASEISFERSICSRMDSIVASTLLILLETGPGEYHCRSARRYSSETGTTRERRRGRTDSRESP